MTVEHLFTKQIHVAFRAIIQLRPNATCDGDIGVRGNLNHGAVQRYLSRFVVDGFI